MFTFSGLVFIFFCLPELKGGSIESMDDRFEHSTWTMWTRAYPAGADKVRHGFQEQVSEGKDLIDEATSRRVSRVDYQKNVTAACHVETK